jgi:PAS domain S-box-containing protein
MTNLAHQLQRPDNDGGPSPLSDSRLLAAIVESCDDAIVSKSLDGVVTSWNRGAELIFGYTEREMVGRPIAVIAAPGREQEVAGILAKVRRGEKVEHFETVRRTKDGRLIDVSVTVSPVRDEHGNVVGASKIARDITERKRAEERLRLAQEQFRALVDASSDVVYRMSPDWAEMQPVDGRGLVASTGHPIRNWMEKNVPAFEHARIRDAIQGAVAGKRTFELEHQVIRPDGSLGWTFSRAIPILDSDGRITQWLGAASDVTDRKRAEEALREARSRAEQQARAFEATLSAVRDFVFAFDREERFTFANRALLELWEIPAEAAIGRTMEELGYPEDARLRVTASIREVIATGRPVTDEVPYHNPSGFSGYYAYTLAPVFDAAGAVVQVAGSARDMTRWREAEAALKEADRRKDEFLAMLAHELRGPLAAVLNAVQVLRLKGPPEPDLVWGRDVVQRQARQLTSIIDDLLDVSRIRSGKIRLALQPCDAGTILKQAIESAEPLIRERKHRLVTDFREGGLPLCADPSRVQQIVANLLTNAAKYSEDGGRIELSAARDGDEIVIAVKDTGMGIPPEKLPHMFELFAQGEPGTARSEGGLGIGLTIVQKLTEMHGGTVTAGSEGPGKGSTFTVRLPAASPDTAAPGTSEATPQPGGGGSRILVVDDNADTARGMVRLLKHLGYDAALAHDGPSAIETARVLNPQFVLLDIGLPGMDGYEVLRRLRREPCCEGAVIMAVSGFGQEEDRLRSRQAGFDHHLVKPVDLDRLVSLLAPPC